MNDFDLSSAGNCVFCGHRPTVEHYSEKMWYIRCTNPFCEKHDPYAYLGSTLKAAIDQWNYVNRPINRTPTQKRKKNDKNNCL